MFFNILKLFISVVPLFLILFIIIILFLKFKNKIRIKYKTFKGKGFLPSNDAFGLYTYCGSQGSGKTYSIVEYLIDNKENIVVYCNIGDITGIDYNFFVGFKGLIDIKNKLDHNTLNYDKNKQLVIVYDEIFTELSRGDKLSKDVIDFLCQMRKRKIIFLTTVQYWAELPITFRRFCRYQIDCKMRRFLRIGLLIKVFHDAEKIKWEQTEQDFIAPIIETTITKCRKKIADSYNTYLRISSIQSFAVGSMPTSNNDNVNGKKL